LFGHDSPSYYGSSTVQQLLLYQLVKYPKNLIVEDEWGALPLLYALWGDAPSEIIHFLINSYQSFYPDHVFEWSTMLITLGQANITVFLLVFDNMCLA
jgi:hypothetical protein